MITRREISLLFVALLSVLSFARAAEDTKKEYGTVIGIGESNSCFIIRTVVF
jgi:hypothetical protein